MVSFEKGAIGRVSAGPGRVAPERRDGDERHVPDELRLEPGVADRKIQIGFRRHIEHRRR